MEFSQSSARDMSNGTTVVKHFSCTISSELKIFARCKKHELYFGSVYLYLEETDMYTISLAKMLRIFRFFDECQN